MKKSAKRSSAKYWVNKEYHDRLKTLSRERYHNDPNYRKNTLERAKRFYHEDAEYREATIRRAKERYQRLKKLKGNDNPSNKKSARNKKSTTKR